MFLALNSFFMLVAMAFLDLRKLNNGYQQVCIYYYSIFYDMKGLDICTGSNTLYREVTEEMTAFRWLTFMCNSKCFMV